MNINEIKQTIFNYELVKAKDNVFILNPTDYAKEKTKLVMEFEGKNNCFNHSTSFRNNDILKYLEKIRCKTKEFVIIIAIKNEVEDYIVFSDKDSCIHAEAYFVKNDKNVSAIDFINKWIKLGAYICNYHNHPYRIAAIPSNNDICAMQPKNIYQNDDNNEWNICVKKYGINIPNNFQYDDWGVITTCDFFSYNQFFDEGHSMTEIYNQNEANYLNATIALRPYTVND